MVSFPKDGHVYMCACVCIHFIYVAVTTGSMAIMTTRATTTIIDGLTTITIPPTNTLSSTNIRENNGILMFLYLAISAHN